METIFSIDSAKKVIADIVMCQGVRVGLWHEQEPPALEGLLPQEGDDPVARLECFALAQHLANHLLWHVEDSARRVDVGDAVIADCKRRIDRLNQSRNDLIERVDAALIVLLAPLLPKDAPERYNTETIGSALDRLSILALKIHHMAEQTRRSDVGPDHVESCERKLATLRRQRDDLLVSALELLDDYALGRKRPKVYFQFKMYNDPSLNPELYARRPG